jgi:glycosyltransferase involved in cell wall biosynthesis
MNLVKIWFVSTRISGNDGVSLEAVRWKKILARMGHKVTFVAGELDRGGILIPELHFNWPDVINLHDEVVYNKNNYKKVEAEIFAVAGKIEGKLRRALNGKPPDLIIVANVFSLPMHFPLAVALTRVIEEYGIKTIARHHDFWWERKRYLRSTMFPFFKRWFPPNLPNIKHVVINFDSQKELKERTGINAEIISDSFDFKSGLNVLDSYSKKFREDFGIAKDDTVFLQATRIVPRKRIEISIDLVKKLGDPKCVLVVCGQSGDEGKEYEDRLRELAKDAGIRAIFNGRYVNARRKIKTLSTMGEAPIRRRVYTLWDAFVNADFVTYPTMLEGFGNQFVEAVYFKKPIIITPYEVYKKDIKPLGFDVVEMPDRVTKETIKEIRNLMSNPKRVGEMTEKNFKLGNKHFSFEATEKKIRQVLENF